MNHIERIARDPLIKKCLASFCERKSYLEDLIIAVQQIPAPTFAEKARADFVERWFSDLGLEDVEQDHLHNVYARWPGKSSSSLNPVVLSAHSDTVFPADTDLSIRLEGRRLYGPGVGDNATGVGGLLLIAQTLKDFDLQTAEDIWFVCNVGEEGLGDLRGMRAAVEKLGSRATYIVVEGGSYGQVMHKAVGVARYRIEVKTEGGHSWGSFGQPSAIHEIGHLVCALSQMNVPEEPRTTFNVGVIEGGTSVNTIAASSSVLLDLRSENADELRKLVSQFKEIVAERRALAGRREEPVAYIVSKVGDRPAGELSRNAPLIQWAKGALEFVGYSSIRFIAGSTDANIPMSMGINSVCIGLTHSANSHRLDEYIELGSLPFGMQQLLLLTSAAAGL